MNSTQNMSYISIIINDIVWVYDSSGVQSKKKYGSLYEPILMVAKSDKTKHTFNHEDILVEAKPELKGGLIDYRKNPPQPYNTQRVPGNVWEFPRVRYKHEYLEEINKSTRSYERSG